jgi:general secretion pathway protein G
MDWQGKTAKGTVMKASERNQGFTLIELLVVMMIIVILAGTGTMLYTNSVTKAHEAALLQDLTVMRRALDDYFADKNKYPPSLETLVEEKYLRAIPRDPFTQSTDTWQIELSEPEPGNPSAEPGVFDVKSGSDRIAIDGTPYAEW